MAQRNGSIFPAAWLLFLCLVILGIGAACQSPEVQLPEPCRELTLSSPQARETVVTMWSYSARFDCWTAYGPTAAVQNNPDLKIHLAVEGFPIDKGFYYQQTEERLAAGSQPDLIVAGEDNASRWFHRGYISSLVPCFERQPILGEIVPALLAKVSANGEPYAIPIATDLSVLYYNKHLLQQLGWSQSQIESLPERIATGSFTLFDMVQTGRQAIDQGVVQPGYAIWPERTSRNIRNLYPAFGGHYYDPVQAQYAFDMQAFQNAAAYGQSLYENQLTLPAFADNHEIDWADRLIQLDIIAQNRVLFWDSTISRVADFWHDTELKADFLTQFGMALFPTAVAGNRPVLQAGSVTLVATPAAFRTEAQLEATCSILAETIKPENSVPRLAATFHWGVTAASQTAPAFRNHPLYQELNAMLDYLPYEPEWMAYEEAYEAAMAVSFGLVEAGKLSPEAAAEQVAAELEASFGNDVEIIR